MARENPFSSKSLAISRGATAYDEAQGTTINLPMTVVPPSNYDKAYAANTPTFPGAWLFNPDGGAIAHFGETLVQSNNPGAELQGSRREASPPALEKARRRAKPHIASRREFETPFQTIRSTVASVCVTAHLRSAVRSSGRSCAISPILRPTAQSTGCASMSSSTNRLSGSNTSMRVFHLRARP